jgi:ADP-ribosylglycohydrolase
MKSASAKNALMNLFVGDALSMPVHWFYNPGDIIRVFGVHGVQRMEAAPKHHPSSIMVLHSTKAGGRRAVESRTTQSASVEVVGDVILKGKRDYWGQPGMHYHHGLPAGENTLNAWWARELMQFLLDEGEYSVNTWVDRYIDFMTASPPQHPDTYAESCHRGFFANWAAGVPPLECGAVTHDTPSMGALVTVAPLVIALSKSHALPQIQTTVRSHVWLTHPDNGLMGVVDAYAALLYALLNASESNEADVAEGGPNGGLGGNPGQRVLLGHLQDAINATGRVELSALVQQKRGDAAVVGGRYSLACYIDDSWPSVCYLAAKYAQNPAKALLTNTNLGGENAHRGAVLGTLVGASSGLVQTEASTELHALQKQLANHDSLTSLIDAFVARFLL